MGRYQFYLKPGLGSTYGNVGIRLKPILWGQKRVSPTFRDYSEGSPKLWGRTLIEVAEDLKSGTISPDEIPIDYVIYNGQRVAVNNRGLTALRMADMEPTVTRQVPLTAKIEERIGENLSSAVLGSWAKNYSTPGYRILVSGNADGTNPIYSVFLPK